jgi:quinol-cytochrome oxidoreductase complex cytochrome b subunit
MSAFARVRELLSAELRQIAPPSVGFWQILGGLTLFLLFLEITTGILLMVYYRPSADEAYESVFYIINDVQLGWLIHGMHRWGAQLFIMLVLVHLIRVYFAEAYRERELNWVIGVVLLLVVGAFAFTGTLLVWDQRAFWSTDAVRRVLAEIPIVGRAILYFLWGRHRARRQRAAAILCLSCGAAALDSYRACHGPSVFSKPSGNLSQS